MGLSRILDTMIATDPGRPRVTYYRDSTGERIDLSARVLLNWVAKASNWLADEGIEPGDRVRLELPADHWRTQYWALAIWRSGAVVCLDHDASLTVGLEESAGADLGEPDGSLAVSPIATFPDAVGPAAHSALDSVATDGGGEHHTFESLIENLPDHSRVLANGHLVHNLRAGLSAFACDGSLVLIRDEDPGLREDRLHSEGISLVL
jgi:hypothetical protein